MYIVMKDGPKKGEIQEMKFVIARSLIQAGRAEQYFFDRQPLAPEKVAEEAKLPVVVKLKKKKK